MERQENLALEMAQYFIASLDDEALERLYELSKRHETVD